VTRSSRLTMTDCGLAAFGVTRTPAADLPALRQTIAAQLPAGVLKYADDQTVASVAAVVHAIETFHLQRPTFSDWGVVAAPQFLGRASFADALERFDRRGPVAVSPLIVPYLSLHSMAANICLALGSHGPSFGAGGGPNSLAEGLLAGMTLQGSARVPGVWVIVSEFDPDATHDEAPECHAVALALTSPDPAQACLRMVVACDPTTTPRVADLGRCLTEGSQNWSCRLGGGFQVELHQSRCRFLNRAA
jgi:hypothetical protein